MTTLFSSILPGNGDTYEGLDDDDSEDRAGDDGDSGTEEAELSGTYEPDSKSDTAENQE